jgi:hypothetical protein
MCFRVFTENLFALDPLSLYLLSLLIDGDLHIPLLVPLRHKSKARKNMLKRLAYEPDAEPEMQRTA